MTELADTLAVIAGLDLTESHARAAADLLRDRLAHGTPPSAQQRSSSSLSWRKGAASEPRGWFPGSSATPL